MTGRWLKPVFLGFMGLLMPMLAVLVWLGATESGLRWVYGQAVGHVPGEIRVTELHGRLLGTLDASGVEYRHQGVRLVADRISLEWRPLALLSGGMHISRLHVDTLDITLPENEKPQPTPESITLPEIHLPWRLVLDDLRIDDLSLRQGQHRFSLERLTLDASSLFSRVDIEHLGLRDASFEMDIQGKLKLSEHYTHTLALNWRATLDSGARVSGSGRIDGDLQATHIEQRTRGALVLTLDGKLREMLQDLQWEARADVTDFDLARLRHAWPAISGKMQFEARGTLDTATLSGSAESIYDGQDAVKARFELRRGPDNRLNFDTLVLHAPATDTRLNIGGHWTPAADGGDVALDLDWRNLRWPLQTGAWFSSAEGKGHLEGRLEDYRLTLTTDRPWPGIPVSTWHARAHGDRTGLDFDSLRIEALDGEALIKGRLHWSPRLSWQAQAHVENINPKNLLAQWDGRLEADLTSSGRLENGEWQAQGAINRLSGRLRGYPVSLHSRLAWRNRGLNIPLFELQSGDSHIDLKGRIADTLALDWSVDSANLAQLYPQAAGRLQASGRIEGAGSAPRIDARVEGRDLGLTDYAIGRLEGDLGLDLFRWQETDIKLVAENLEFNTYTLESLKIDANSRSLGLETRSGTSRTRVQLRGQPTAGGWAGRIEQLAMTSEPFGDWQLAEPAPVSLEGRDISVKQVCWVSQPGRLCADLDSDDGRWQSRVVAQHLPLGLIGPWLPANLRLEGRADGSAELHYTAPDQLRGRVAIALPAGVVSYPLLEAQQRERWDYDDGRLDITLDDTGLALAARLKTGNGDRLEGELSLPGARLLALDRDTQTLLGELRVNIRDLGIVEALLPEVHDLTGELAANLRVRGTLASPRLSGDARLSKGALRIPRLDLSIEPFSISARSEQQHLVRFQGDARSGDGQLEIQGQTRLDPRAGWPTSIRIIGERFRVAHIPEARVEVSPDLTIKVEQRRIHVTGDVNVPYARLQPRDITTAAQVSEDAVIVGEDRIKEEKWRISSEVRVTLGDRVNFFGFGFDSRLGGSLVLTEEPGQVTTATGTISIEEGLYRAYGQRLDITRGNLLYTGGPLDNPGLDLRAVRQVNNVTAGLDVRGSLRHPEVELFSIPAMGQTDALSYLLLGRPLETASGDEGSMMARAALALSLSGGDHLARILGGRFGLDEFRVESSESGDQASLVVGRYLSPRLYVSYGVGLIESFNTLNVRYQISRHWQLKGESGEHQGADLLYTIER